MRRYVRPPARPKIRSEPKHVICRLCGRHFFTREDRLNHLRGKHGRPRKGQR